MTDLTKCPKCGGEADNGFDRCFPPNPYNCTKCEGEPEMTNDKMPDVIWASSRPQDVGNRWTGTDKCYSDQTKYIRADLVPQWQQIQSAPNDTNIDTFGVIDDIHGMQFVRVADDYISSNTVYPLV